MRQVDLGGGGTAHYTYDAAGQRVRKVWEHSGLVEERIYLGGWEVYRRYQATDMSKPVLERATLHMIDGMRRIALVETSTIDTSAGGAFQPKTVTRFQMGNHLGSAVLEVDESGRVISYEEYHPHGTTAYTSGASVAEVSRKRYRYTGKEKDEETGLYYHGARHYAPWLGRWTSADPAGLVDGTNVYAYCGNNPIRYRDQDGKTKTPGEMFYDLYQVHNRLAATLQARGAPPETVASIQTIAENFKRLAIDGAGGESGLPLAAAFGGSAAFPTLKPPTVRADAPDSVRPLMELSNQAVPQVQAATVRGLQTGAVIAMTLPGAAAGGAAASQSIPGVGRGVMTAGRETAGTVQKVTATATGLAAAYNQRLVNFANAALENVQTGSDPVEAVAGAGAGEVPGTIAKGRAAGQIEKKLGDAVSMMTSGSGNGSFASSAQRVIASLAQSAFRIFNCGNCANIMGKALKKEAIPGIRLSMRVVSPISGNANWKTQIWSDRLQKNIAEDGVHEAIQVGV